MTTESVRRIVRFIVSGGTAAVVNIGTLYVLTSFLGIWYIFASVLAFFAGLGVSFTMQKFWTFRDHRTEHMHKQALTFFVIVVINLGINTALVWGMVEYLSAPVILAQLVAGGLIAFGSFFSYRYLVFHSRGRSSIIDSIEQIEAL